jgi:hypothetical protein
MDVEPLYITDIHSPLIKYFLWYYQTNTSILIWTCLGGNQNVQILDKY